MSITNGYTTLSALKAKLGITDSTDDTMLENVIEGVSRWIDAYCNRTFYASTTGEVRAYTPITYGLCMTDDIAAISSVKLDLGSRTYGTTLATSDYDTVPYNAAAKGMPIMGISVTPNGLHSFYPTVELSVQITGTFGFTSGHPWLETVREACELQCERIYKRKDSPLGAAGTTATGDLKLMQELDPDVKAMLAPPLRRTVRL